MKASIDRKKIGRSFHRQAAEYDRHASVQKRVVSRLVELVNSHVVGIPASILDIGCGTGQLLSSLRDQYPDSRLTGLDLAGNMIQCASERLGSAGQFVNADAEQLPFRKGIFDLLVSTSTLQWLDTLDVFFHQAQRVTHVNGLVCVAFFGGRTLCELRECYRHVVSQNVEACSDYEDRLHRFMDRTAVESVLKRMDFDQALVISEIETECYPDVYELLRSIKRIGAGVSAQGNNKAGLGWRGILDEVSRLYSERYGSGAEITATYEVIYVVARSRVRI